LRIVCMHLQMFLNSSVIDRFAIAVKILPLLFHEVSSKWRLPTSRSITHSICMLRVNITELCQIYRRWLEIIVFFPYPSMDKIWGTTTFKQWESTSCKLISFHIAMGMHNVHSGIRTVLPKQSRHPNFTFMVALTSLLVDFARSSTQNNAL